MKDVSRTPEAKIVEDLIRYDLDKPCLDRFFLMCSNLTKREKIELIVFLKAHIEVFIWTLYEMLGIDPSFIKNELNVILDTRPIKQWGRRSTTGHVDTVLEEVKKLKEISVITEVLYPI